MNRFKSSPVAFVVLAPGDCSPWRAARVRLTSASHQPDKVAADQFEVNRRIVIYNGVTDQYMLVIQGLCSLGNQDTSRENLRHL
jgi:hypothetical protein